MPHLAHKTQPRPRQWAMYPTKAEARAMPLASLNTCASDAAILQMAGRYADQLFGAYAIESDATETHILGAMK